MESLLPICTYSPRDTVSLSITEIDPALKSSNCLLLGLWEHKALNSLYKNMVSYV